MNSTYNSYTYGAIPLSFEARRLMQNLRHAIVHGISASAYSNDDNAIAKARGELAKYMSKLEGKNRPYAGATVNATVDFETRARNLWNDTPLWKGTFREQVAQQTVGVLRQELKRLENQWTAEFEKLRERLSMVDSMYGGLQRRTIALEEVAAQRGSKNRALLFGLSERVAKLEEAAKPKPRKRKVAARRSRK